MCDARSETASRPRTIAALLLVVVAVPAHATAQELDLRLALDGPAADQCGRWTPPTEAPGPQDSTQALSLLSSATEASILGNTERTRELLELALERDPASPELNYRFGRTLEDLHQLDGARDAFCRVLAVDEDPERRGDAEARIEAMAEQQRAEISEAALTAFESGADAARRGRTEEAADFFSLAVEEAPDWAAARYNLGVLLAELGTEDHAASNLQRYLELSPDAADAMAVAQQVGRLEGTRTVRAADGSTVLALGLLFPGMGQFYSGRKWMGATVLGLSAGAIAAGLLNEEVNVRCLGGVDAGRCPESRVVARETTRPLLAPAIATAVVVTVAGAVEAFFRAPRGSTSPLFRDDDGAAQEEEETVRGLSVHGPSVGVSPRGLDVSFVGLRFR